MRRSTFKARLDALERALLAPGDVRHFVTHDGVTFVEEVLSPDRIDYRRGLVVDAHARRWTRADVEALAVSWEVTILDWSGHDTRSEEVETVNRRG